MRHDVDQLKGFSRRLMLLAGGKLALIGLLVGRLYQLQIVESERFATLADENRINLRLLPPPRGRLVDRAGRPLAVNRQNYRLVLIAERSGDAEEVLGRLARTIPLSEADRIRVLREVGRKRSFVPITVRENLSWAEVSRVEVHTPDLPGLLIEVGRSRHYPHGALAAHAVGYVGAVSEAELSDDPLLELPDFKIGKTGIERYYDAALRGRAGNSQVEVNAVGRVIRELSREEGVPGDEIGLSLDIELQAFTAARLTGQESAAGVVMDVHTGEVLAMCSSPSYDPNAFTDGISNADWATLSGNPRAPLSNKCIAGQYAPGSTFKMVVALAGLEAGIITPQQSFFCPGKLQFGDGTFHCWKRHGHGHMDLHEAIKQSCDVYFYEVAKRCGIDRIAAMANRLGLGQPLGVDLPGERAGLMPTKEWKLAQLGKAWLQGETLVAGIGQGFVLATPLQLAVMTARLVNGGFAVRPRLVRRIGEVAEPDLPTPEPLGIARAHLEAMLRSMDGVVNEMQGTAYGSRIDFEELAMGGKTGTSQVRRISTREREQGVRKNEDVPWRMRDHALFVGFAPVHAPRYACAVIVEHGGSGSAIAAPIARDLLIETQRRDPSRGRPARLASTGAGG